MKKIFSKVLLVLATTIGVIIAIVIFAYQIGICVYQDEIVEGKEKIKNLSKETIVLDYPSDVGEYEFLDIDEISPYLTRGYVAVEDRDFYNHHGLNFSSLGRATISLIKNKGAIKEGGSSITQQVIKNNVLTQERTFKRKFIEMLLTYDLESKFTKDEIMELYCNTNYYANGCYGVNSASLYYFGKDCKNLNIVESAMLVGVSNSPTNYDPINNFDNSWKKTKKVLKIMYNQGVITEEEYYNALDNPPIIQNHDSNDEDL